LLDPYLLFLEETEAYMPNFPRSSFAITQNMRGNSAGTKMRGEEDEWAKRGAQWRRCGHDLRDLEGRGGEGRRGTGDLGLPPSVPVWSEINADQFV